MILGPDDEIRMTHQNTSASLLAKGRRSLLTTLRQLRALGRAPSPWVAKTWPSERCAPATPGMPPLRETRHVPASAPLHPPRAPLQVSLTALHTLVQLARPYPRVSYSEVSSTGTPISLFSYVRFKINRVRISNVETWKQMFLIFRMNVRIQESSPNVSGIGLVFKCRYLMEDAKF